MPQSITHDFLFRVLGQGPTVPPIGTATIAVDKADHVVASGDVVTVIAEVLGAVEVYADSPAGRIDLSPTGGTFSFTPQVSGPFPLVVIDAAGGKTVKPMSVIVKYDRPALDPTAPPTLTTVQNGPLDDPATWGGRLPTADETVEVKHGCTYSGRKFWCGRLINTGAIVVRGGVLHTTDYDDRGVGALNLIGEGVDKALVMLHNRPRHPNDTAHVGRSVRVRGTLTIRGKAKSRRAILNGARVGDTRLTLLAPVSGWGVGDKVLLQDTRRLDDNPARQEEVCVVRGVSADGLTVYLLSPVRLDHLPYTEKDGSVFSPVKVLNLIANAGFVTSDPTTVATRCSVHISGAARLDADHWLAHATGRHSTGGLASLEPYDANPMGLHNLVGPPGGVGEVIPWPDGSVRPPQFRLTNGVSLEPAPVVPVGTSQVSWGVLLNNSHYGLVEGNNVFNWHGAGVVCFDGNETRNLVRNNNVVALVPAGHNEGRFGNENVAHTSTAFWFRGPGNWVLDNFASGCDRGYVVAPYVRGGAGEVKVPVAPGEDPYKGRHALIDLRNTPLVGFENNEAGGRIMNAVELWHIGTNPYGSGPAVNFRESVVKGLVAWRLRDHVFYNYMTAGVTFDGCRARGGWLAFFSSDYVCVDFKLKRCDLRGFGTGWAVGPLSNQSLEDCYFETDVGVSVGLLWIAGSDARAIPPRTVRLKGLRWSPHATTGSAIYMGPWREPGGSDVVNAVAPNKVLVEDFQGQIGDNFRVYFYDQDGERLTPATVILPDGKYKVIGAPSPGKTNAQNWAEHGLAFAGAVTPPGGIVRNDIVGVTHPLTVATL